MHTNRKLTPLFITSLAIASPMGKGLDATYKSLREQKSGLRKCDFDNVDLTTYIGRVTEVEDIKIDPHLAYYDCRNNRLAQLGLQQDNFLSNVNAAKQRYGADRIGLFMGTSTAGIHATELAYQNRNPETGKLPSSFHNAETNNNFSIADFVQRSLQLQGPALTVSTACSSSAKVFANAARYIASGLCDAAIVGGCDSLCLTTLYGFSSLELVSAQACRPADINRNGLSIGEAAGFALLETSPGDISEPIALLGYGETSDAHHMSTPHPQGLGAQLAMEQALASAALNASDIDYINLHGTATPVNDLAEDKAVMSVFGNQTPCSSTKGWTGHALGAAGIVEAIIACLSIQHGFVPISLNTKDKDPEIQTNIAMQALEQPVHRVLTNSFGFGGNNCALVLGRVET